MKFSDELRADCTPEQAEALIRYDHQVVTVDGRRGVMLTYHWMLEGKPARELIVVFQYADAHPPAPPDIQGIIDKLMFKSKEE
jgi:hypothetical protein